MAMLRPGVYKTEIDVKKYVYTPYWVIEKVLTELCIPSLFYKIKPLNNHSFLGFIVYVPQTRIEEVRSILSKESKSDVLVKGIEDEWKKGKKNF